MFKFDLQLFGGGKGEETSTSSREIPPATGNEKLLEAGLLGYNTNGLNSASGVLNSGVSKIGDTYSPNWQNVLDKYNTSLGSALGDYTQSSANNLSKYNKELATENGWYTQDINKIYDAYSSLADGNLPAAYAKNRQAALQDDLDNTVGSTVNNLGNRGVINSSVTNKALSDISQNASDTLAKQYTQDLQTQSGLIGNQSNTIANAYNTLSGANQNAYNAGNTTASGIYGNTANAAQSSFNNTGAAQTGSYSQPTQYLSWANSLSSPAQSMWQNYYNGRMGTGTTTTTKDDGGASTWGAIGQLGSAYIMACFVADTMVQTPDGDKPIYHINPGDDVFSLDDDDRICIRKVLAVRPAFCRPIVDVHFSNGAVWHTTESQRVYTCPWFEYVGKAETPAVTMAGKSEIKKTMETKKYAMVYDLIVDGRNIFFAEGVAAEGYGD